MTIFTIGFTQKNARQFFTLLTDNAVQLIVDIRLNNISQLAGFAKRDDLAYLAKAIGNIDYLHYPLFSPTEELLHAYKTKEIDWDGYEKRFSTILKERNTIKDFQNSIKGYNRICLLCSEPTAEHCHRRLVAEYLQKHIKGSAIQHL